MRLQTPVVQIDESSRSQRKSTSPEVVDHQFREGHSYPLHVTLSKVTREYLGPEEGGTYSDMISPIETFVAHNESQLEQIVDRLKHENQTSTNPQDYYYRGKPRIDISKEPYKGYSPYPYRYE